MKKFSLILIFFLISSALSAQPISAEERERFTEQLEVILKSAPFQNANWKTIDSYISDKKLVVIGEFSHGAREIFELQTSLVKHLHENHGFDVVLFESGIGELLPLNREKSTLSPDELVSGFFGGWRNEERMELMAYLAESNIDFAGFDVQRFGGNFNEALQLEALSKGIDSTAINDLESRFTTIAAALRNQPYDSIEPRTRELTAAYGKASDLLKSKKGDPMVIKTLENRVAFLQYYLQFNRDRDWVTRFNSRDSVMATNVVWLMNQVFKDRKIVLITHNYHGSRYNEKNTTMGEILSELYADQLLSIGAFAGSGTYHNNAGKPEQIAKPDEVQLDLKHLFQDQEGYGFLVDVTSNMWIFDRSMIVNDTFIDLWGSNEMILARHFDLILYLQSVSPPE